MRRRRRSSSTTIVMQGAELTTLLDHLTLYNLLDVRLRLSSQVVSSVPTDLETDAMRKEIRMAWRGVLDRLSLRILKGEVSLREIDFDTAYSFLLEGFTGERYELYAYLLNFDRSIEGD